MLCLLVEGVFVKQRGCQSATGVSGVAGCFEQAAKPIGFSPVPGGSVELVTGIVISNIEIDVVVLIRVINESHIDTAHTGIDHLRGILIDGVTTGFTVHGSDYSRCAARRYT